MAHEFGHAVQARVGATTSSIARPRRRPTATPAAGPVGRRGQRQALPPAHARARRAAPGLPAAARPGRHRHPDAVGPRLLLRPGLRLPGGVRRRRTRLPRPLRARPRLHAGPVHHRHGLRPSGDAPYGELWTSSRSPSPRCGTRRSRRLRQGLRPPSIRRYPGDAPECAGDPDRELVFCGDEQLVGIDERKLAGPPTRTSATSPSPRRCRSPTASRCATSWGCPPTTGTPSSRPCA